MISYRESLRGIEQRARNFAYRSFTSRPDSLRQAIRSMDAPASADWSQVRDVFRDERWTDEVQGVAWTGTHWIFSTNANQIKPGSRRKGLYLFTPRSDLKDDHWVSFVRFTNEGSGLSDAAPSDHHWGQVTFHAGRLYVSHFWEEGSRKDGSNVVVFDVDGNQLSAPRWVPLPKVRRRKVEFQALNPWDNRFYTCFGDGRIDEFFIHELDGSLTGRSLRLSNPIAKVQGACFSSNGHLYVASNSSFEGDPQRQTVAIYSALNGHHFGSFGVPALREFKADELEGICFADLSLPGGQRAQIHLVLLENRNIALDNIFFKSFAAADPDLV